jgi:Carboxypeptidase regulatory-like domain
MAERVGWLGVRILGSVFVVLAATAAVRAQEATGSIRGSVTDPSGASVGRAQVSVIQTETGLTRKTGSDADGAYLLVLLPVGHYHLEAVAAGFRKYVQEGITLSVNQVAPIPIQLVIGSSQQTVQVKSDAVLLATTNDLGETVGQQQIVDLPLNGRNFTQLGLLQPGVAPVTPGLLAAGGPLRAMQAYAVNGLRPESNQFLIDGVENYDVVYAGYVLQPPLDALSEFRILTNTASAEFGHSAGSTTNIVTRSGSNQFHGAVWEFLRNNVLDARNFFSQDVPTLKQNQFGGTFGGPIRHEKTFFFGYYEGFRNREGVTFTSPVPSTLERQGDFSQTIDPSSGEVLPLVNEITGQTYPGNKLPSIDPISQNLLTYYPLANIGTNLFVASPNLRSDRDQFGARVDHYFSSQDSIFVRYNFSNGSEFDPLAVSGATVPGFPVQENDRSQNVVIQETRSFSPMLVNIARASFLRHKFLDVQGLNHTDPSSVGFQFPTTLPSQNGLPYIDIPGYGNLGNPLTGPRNTYQNTWALTDSLTWVRGKHELQFGGGYRHDQINAVQGIASNGYFVFATFPISNTFASFLDGAPVVFLQGGGYLPRGLRGNSFNGYIQDSYKPTSRLTINAGLRYELTYPFTEVHNQQFLWIPGEQSKVMPSAPVGLLYPGDPGVPAGLIPTDYRGFAPRLGLAWDPTGSGKWTVRSAYGIFYEPFYNGQGGPLQDIISAPPWFKIIQVGSPNYANPTAGLDPLSPGFNYPLLFDSLDPHMRLPYAQDWNFTVQRSIGNNWIAEMAYVGTKGTKLPRFIEVNPAIYVPGMCGSQPCSTENNTDQRRPHSGCTLDEPESDCLYTSEAYLSGIVNSSYSGLQASLRRRASHGVSFLASYVYSKTLDDNSSFNMTGGSSQDIAGENDLAQNPFDLEAEYGRSLFDQRQRFVFSYEWQLPSLSGASAFYHQAFGNWQVNGILTLSTGTPFTVYDSTDVALLGGAQEVSGFSANRPDLISNPNNGPKTAQEWFDINAFQRLNPETQAGQFGNAGRNVTQAAGLGQFDFSVFKNFRLTESKTLQFRSEFFNLFNRVNFGLPYHDISSPTFGQVESALPPREIQFALKLLF